MIELADIASMDLDHRRQTMGVGQPDRCPTIGIGPWGKYDIRRELIDGAAKRRPDRFKVEAAIPAAQDPGCIPITRMFDQYSIMLRATCMGHAQPLPAAYGELVDPQGRGDHPDLVKRCEQPQLMPIEGGTMRLDRAGVQVGQGQDPHAASRPCAITCAAW